MSIDLPIAMCGLSSKDERMVQIVLTRATGVSSRRRCVIVDPASVASVALVIVDVQSPFGLEALDKVRSRHPAVVPIFLSDDGRGGAGEFKLSRRSLLVELLRVVDAAAHQVASASGSKVASPNKLAATPRPEPVAMIETRTSAQANKSVEKFLPLTALVVDDSAAVRAQLEGALSRAGVTCVQAASADQALLHTQQRHFDLIILDVVMPGRDGYQVCREIRQNRYTRNAPVVMLTSRSTPFDRARGALAGCSAYLVKPIDSKSFFAAVDKVLLKSFNDDRKQMYERGYRDAIAPA